MLVALASVLAAACGGGGSDSTAPLPAADQSVSRACRAATGATGYDVVLMIGQSNMTGYGAYVVPAFDAPDARVKQWNRAGAIVEAKHPMEHADYPLNANRIGMGIAFGKQLAAVRPANRTVLLVPAASGGTGFFRGNWLPNGDLYVDAVKRVNAALAQNPAGNCLAAILWHQGEDDVQSTLPYAEYQFRLDEMVRNFRAAVSGGQASDVPFVGGELSPEWTAPEPGRKPAINAIIQAMPSRLAYVSVVRVEGLRSNLTQGLSAGAVHFDAASQRELGLRYFAALSSANQNTSGAR